MVSVVPMILLTLTEIEKNYYIITVVGNTLLGNGSGS